MPNGSGQRLGTSSRSLWIERRRHEMRVEPTGEGDPQGGLRVHQLEGARGQRLVQRAGARHLQVHRHRQRGGRAGRGFQAMSAPFDASRRPR
jgi:hypothetical protein